MNTTRKVPFVRSHQLLTVATLALAATCCRPTYAQSNTPAAVPASAPATSANDQATSEHDRSAAYYHFGLAHMYEEMATNYGRPEYATRAIEEYKLALNADPELEIPE